MFSCIYIGGGFVFECLTLDGLELDVVFSCSVVFSVSGLMLIFSFSVSVSKQSAKLLNLFADIWIYSVHIFNFVYFGDWC